MDPHGIDWARHGKNLVAVPEALEALHSEEEDERNDAVSYFEHEVFRAGGADVVPSAALLDALPFLADFVAETDDAVGDEQATIADLLMLLGAAVGPSAREGEGELFSRTREALEDHFPIALEAAP